MKILYLTNQGEDYLSDNILYGLRKKFGPDLVDFPRKDLMYDTCQVPNDQIYGRGMTLWKLLPDIEIDRSRVMDQLFNSEFDIVIFSSIYRMQALFAHFTVYDYFKVKSKFVFLDGEDDGFPTVYDAFHCGVYFKRDNPFKYPQINIIGLSIPECKILKDKPVKTKLLTAHCQCDEAYGWAEVAKQCSKQGPFKTEKDYYTDLASSQYGITMKKSGWDTPRHMENAANWVVNCIWKFDKPPEVHPLGFRDGENCIVWQTADELKEKIKNANYDKLQQGSHDWVLTKTCEKMADYVLSKV